MIPLGAQFRARVGRRIVALFVLSALAPVLVMAAVSFSAVNGQLEEHSEERLRQLAKNAGQSIVQQIMLAEAGLRAYAVGLASDQPMAPATLPAEITGLALLQADGSMQPLLGDPDYDWTMPAAERARLADGALALQATPNAQHDLVMAVPLSTGDSLGPSLWARVRGDSIWSAAEVFSSLPTVADFCVMSGRTRPLYCSSGTRRFTDAFGSTDAGGTLGTLAHSDGGDEFMVGYWSFYPTASFEAPPWTVLVAEDMGSVYAPLGVFSTTFGLSLVLAILLVVLLSNVQIRQTLEPLRALSAGTDRIIGGDLKSRIEVSTDDEFGALAGSFNDMAGQLETQFAQLGALQAVAESALGTFDRDEVIGTALDETLRVSNARSVAILHAPLAASSPGQLLWRTGPDAVVSSASRLTLEDITWMRAHPEHGDDADAAPPFMQGARRGLGNGRLVAFPHIVKGDVHGATIVEWAGVTESVEPDAIRRVRRLTDQVVIALEDVRLVQELEELSVGALVALARAIDAKSDWTAGHSERVTEMALALGREMGLDAKDMDILHRGGLLHDVGKIGVPNAILDKAGPLTDDEFERVKLHPEIGERILSPIAAFAPVMPLVLHHHEHWDGSGYPHGLAREEIHPLTRILAVADAYDAMATARPYRPGRPPHVVADIIVSDSGRQFDPEVVDALVRLMSARGLIQTKEMTRVAV